MSRSEPCCLIGGGGGIMKISAPPHQGPLSAYHQFKSEWGGGGALLPHSHHDEVIVSEGHVTQ